MTIQEVLYKKRTKVQYKTLLEGKYVDYLITQVGLQLVQMIELDVKQQDLRMTLPSLMQIVDVLGEDGTFDTHGELMVD